MSLLGLSGNYRKAAKEGMNVLAMNEKERDAANRNLEEQEKAQRMSMATTGAGLGVGAAFLTGAASQGMGAAATLGAVAPWAIAGLGAGYLLSRLF